MNCDCCFAYVMCLSLLWYCQFVPKQSSIPNSARSMMQAMEAEFRREAALRLRVLDGECIDDDLQPLYSTRTEELRCPWLRTQTSRKRKTEQSFLVQDLRQFRTLYKAFAGSVAHLQLPQGCFFAGSSVLACTQLRAEFYDNKRLKHFLRDYDLAAEGAWQFRFIALRRCGLPRALAKKILCYCETTDDAEELRRDICGFYPEREHDTPEWDCLDWSPGGVITMGCRPRSECVRKLVRLSS